MGSRPRRATVPLLHAVTALRIYTYVRVCHRCPLPPHLTIREAATLLSPVPLPSPHTPPFTRSATLYMHIYACGTGRDVMIGYLRSRTRSRFSELAEMADEKYPSDGWISDFCPHKRRHVAREGGMGGMGGHDIGMSMARHGAAWGALIMRGHGRTCVDTGQHCSSERQKEMTRREKKRERKSRCPFHSYRRRWRPTLQATPPPPRFEETE